jgi:ATP-dependent Clp protease adaptor protein ClpS
VSFVGEAAPDVIARAARFDERLKVIGEPHLVVSRFRAGVALLARWLFSPRGAGRAAASVVQANPPQLLRIAPTAAREPRKAPDSPGNGTAVITRTRTQTKRPSMYRVLLLNDDYTPMEFVILVLQSYFNKNPEEATQIMLHVHHHGVGECGVFTYEIAETKVAQVMDHARKNQHPLQCIMEKK